MRINNRTFNGPSIQILVIPREDGDIVFKAQAVLDTTEFDAICPMPVPPGIIRPNQPPAVNLQDKDYLEAVKKRNDQYGDWIFLKSLAPTEGLTWETVKMDDPETWKNYISEFKSAGFNNGEINRIINFSVGVNGVDEQKLKEAKDRFLASTRVAQVTDSLPVGQ